MDLEDKKNIFPKSKCINGLEDHIEHCKYFRKLIYKIIWERELFRSLKYLFLFNPEF